MPKIIKKALPDKEIVHAKWTEQNGDHEWQLYVFINPDKNSAVAAIMMSTDATYAGPHLCLELVERDGQSSHATEAYRNVGLQFSPMQTSLSDRQEEIFKMLGVGHDGFSTQIMNYAGSLDGMSFGGKKLDEKGHGQTAWRVFRETDILSSDPAIREALLQAITAQFKSLKALSAPPRSIQQEY